MPEEPAVDGIDSLTTAFRRPQRERTMPPAKHKPRGTAIPLTQTTEAQIPAASPSPEPPEVRRLRPTSKPAGETSRATEGALAPSTISLDRKTEEVLEAVRTAGRFASPKVDANRSATIRLAVARLSEQLTPEEIAAELRLRAPKAQAATGRKRM